MFAGIFNQRTVFLFLVFWIVPNFVWADHCAVSKIAIIAGTWENTDTKTSHTVQSQDSNGESCHVSQTLRLSFESTGGGSYTGQTGSPVQAWISSNSANRNFYYLHSADADYVLTIKAGYGATDSWETLFTGTHNTAGTSSQETSTTSPTAETAANTSPSQSSSSSATSAHYSAAPLSFLSQTTKYAVSAGRDRLGVVGSPLEFRAETDLEYTRNSIFKWNFGDGSEKAGEVVTHTYEYPGEYVVVLNVSTPGGQVVARTNVKIIEPGLVISSATPERIELKNNSKYEVSLFGRVLMVGGKVFVFPQDTIIKAGQSISFSSKVTGLNPSGIHDVQIMVIGETENSKIGAKIEEQKAEKIAHLENQISILEQNLRQKMAATQNLAVEPPSEDVVAEEKLPALEEPAPAPQTASAKDGWLGTIKRFFLRTQ